MKTKREFRFYTLAEYEKEQKYLERRHREGWKFVRVSGYGIYHFEKCVIIMNIEYNIPGSRAYDPNRDRKKQNVQQVFWIDTSLWGTSVSYKRCYHHACAYQDRVPSDVYAKDSKCYRIWSKTHSNYLLLVIKYIIVRT